MNLTKLYEDAPSSKVFTEVELENTIPGKTYITLDGCRIKMMKEGKFLQLADSPLYDEFTIDDLNSVKQVELFYKLIK